MFGQDREAREKGDRAYYSLPQTGWAQVGPELAEELRRVARAASLAADRLSPEESPEAGSSEPPMPEAAPAPAQLAFRFYELANRLWAEVAGDEQDLRQVITTLRTALAVCWDMYSLRESERTTVAQHMTQLREKIEDFERDLGSLLADRGGRPGAPSP